MSSAHSPILTIGHSIHSLEGFVDLLRRHAVTAVADVRSTPYSRFTPHFNRSELDASLQTLGIRYVFLGRELGARPEDASCYVDGRVHYARLAQTELFRHGLERLQRGAARHRIACMCAEREPLECHRALLVARALAADGVDVAHIHADGRLESHAEALDRLLDLTRLPRADLFRSREELLAEAFLRQERQIAYVDAALAAETQDIAE